MFSPFSFPSNTWKTLYRDGERHDCEEPLITAIPLSPFVTLTKRMLPFQKYLFWHRNEGLKEAGNLHPRLSSTSPSLPSALLKIIPSEQLLRVQVPNCGLILESKSRAFINDISTAEAA